MPKDVSLNFLLQEKVTGLKDIRDVLGQVYETAEELDQNSGQTPGIPTGYRDLDQMTAGFNRNDLIILAARPSVVRLPSLLILPKSCDT